MAEALLRISDVMRITSRGRTTIYRLESQGRFPRRRQVTDGRVAWLASEVERWMKDLPVATGNDTPEEAA